MHQEAAGEIVGFVTVRLDHDTNIGEIGLNVVDLSDTRRGIGTAMYEFASARMPERRDGVGDRLNRGRCEPLSGAAGVSKVSGDDCVRGYAASRLAERGPLAREAVTDLIHFVKDDRGQSTERNAHHTVRRETK